MTSVREYRGVLIHRNTEPTTLRYWALGPDGFLRADTLAGIKQLITHTQKGE